MTGEVIFMKKPFKITNGENENRSEMDNNDTIFNFVAQFVHRCAIRFRFGDISHKSVIVVNNRFIETLGAEKRLT
jgi:hypothetical protein